MWFWISIFTGLSSAVEKVVDRVALKNQNNVAAYTFLYFLFTSLLTLPFIFPLKIHFTLPLIILMVAQILIWTSASIFGFLAHVSTDVSLTTIISRLRMIWVIPLSIFFLNEHLSLLASLGILCIFTGFIVLFFKGTLHTDRGVHFMLLNSLFGAIGITLNAILLRYYLTSPQVTLTDALGETILFSAILLYKRKPVERVRIVLKRGWYLAILAAFLQTIAYVGSGFAYQMGNASAVTAVYAAMTISSIWIGVFFLHEKDHMWRKIISSAIVTCGIIILKLFS